VAGIVPSALLGWLASWWQQRRFVRLTASFRDLPPDAKPSAVFRLTDAREVEILARCCRSWVDEETLNEDAVRLAEAIMKVGWRGVKQQQSLCMGQMQTGLLTWALHSAFPPFTGWHVPFAEKLVHDHPVLILPH
jgi:hypothetical protein